MKYDKAYFVKGLKNSKQKFAELSPDEKAKYLKTAKQMADKARSQMLINPDSALHSDLDAPQMGSKIESEPDNTEP